MTWEQPGSITLAGPPADAARADDIFRLSNFAVAAGSMFFTVAAVLAWLMFRPFVPALAMQAWLVGTGLFMLSWYALAIRFLILQPGVEERRTVWYRAQLYVRFGSNIVVLATIWLFFPFSPHDLQLVMTIFYVAHVPTQILALPQRGLINGIGTIVILGSVAAVQLLFGGPYATTIALFVTCFAVVMIVLGRAEGSVIDDVLAERRKTIAAARRLERALAEVAAERDAKTRFIAAASHDLSHPLQAASLFFDQAMRATDQATQQKAADGVRQAFAAADQLLSHMLNHLRLEADAVDPHCRPIVLGRVLARVATQFGPAAQAAGIALRARPCVTSIETDRALLERALGNLIANAIAHSGARRIIIAKRAAGPDHCRIWVVDDGRGVATADADYLFDDYYQGVDPVSGPKGGFGLGLASVRRIAAVLQGQAGLDRRWRAGAAFYIELPYRQPIRARAS